MLVWQNVLVSCLIWVWKSSWFILTLNLTIFIKAETRDVRLLLKFKYILCSCIIIIIIIIEMIVRY